jgi:hypothetical protein
MSFVRGAKVRDSEPPFRASDQPAEQSGVLLENIRKAGPGDCDLFGSICIEGREYRLRAWRRIGETGAPYLKLRCAPRGAT